MKNALAEDIKYHRLTYVKAFGKMGYTTKLVAQLMRDLGSIPAPMNSFSPGKVLWFAL